MIPYCQELSYDAYLDGHFPYLREVRDFGQWKILTTTDYDAKPQRFLVILDDVAQRQATLLEFEDWNHREETLNLVRRLPGQNGGASSGVAAWLKPVPPSRSPGQAAPLPEPERDDA